jgi:type IV pilus assembly protein PilP
MKAINTCLLALVLVGCGEDEAATTSSPGSVPPAAPGAPQEQATEQDVKKKKDLPPPVDFQETAFIESERSRDPFRNYAKVFVDEARGQVRSQREVVLEQYAIDELKLIALIQRIHPPRAMLVDPTGVGHVVQRGQFVGRASVVQPTGGVGAAYEVNWRVDRIRDGDLVLVRDDPSNPDVPSATRVIPLETESSVAEAAGSDEEGEGGLENELRRMQERLAAMAAAEAAKSRSAGDSEKENP